MNEMKLLSLDEVFKIPVHALIHINSLKLK